MRLICFETIFHLLPGLPFFLPFFDEDLFTVNLCQVFSERFWVVDFVCRMLKLHHWTRSSEKLPYSSKAGGIARMAVSLIVTVFGHLDGHHQPVKDTSSSNRNTPRIIICSSITIQGSSTPRSVGFTQRLMLRNLFDGVFYQAEDTQRKRRKKENEETGT